MIRSLKDLINGKFFSIILFFFSTFIIFGPSLQYWLTEEEQDNIFNILYIVSILFFTLYFVIEIIVLKNFAYSLFYYFELIVIISILFDISWIYKLFFICNDCKDYEGISHSGENRFRVRQALNFYQIFKYIRILRFIYYFKFQNTFKYLKALYFDIKTKREASKVKGYVPISEKNLLKEDNYVRKT